MIGSDLIVEIPWIIFGVLLAAACVRLRRIRHLSGRPRDLESYQPSDEGDDRTANAGEPAGKDHHGAAVPSSARPFAARRRSGDT